MFTQTCAYSNKRPSHPVAPEPGMTLQFLSDHNIITLIMLLCGPRSDFTRSRPPHSSTTRGSIPALHCLIKVQPTSHIPSQPHIHRPPIYTRLLMATLINFTGRQSNKALLWRGGAADVWCNLRNIFKWALTSQATTLVLGGWYQGGRERGRGRGGEVSCMQGKLEKTNEYVRCRGRVESNEGG